MSAHLTTLSLLLSLTLVPARGAEQVSSKPPAREVSGKRLGTIFNNDDNNIIWHMGVHKRPMTPQVYQEYVYRILDLKPGVVAQCVGFPEGTLYPTQVDTCVDKYWAEVCRKTFPATSTSPTPWKPHIVRQLNGSAEQVRLPAKLQIVTESWNRVVAVPYIAYMPERDRLLMLVSCDYPHHPMVLHSDDRGATWSEPRPVGLDKDGKVIPNLGTSLAYLGEGKAIFYTNARWFSRDYGQTWGEATPIAPTPEGKPWYVWDPPLLYRDARTGKPLHLVETGYTWFQPPEVSTAHQQGYLRFSSDGGRTWSEGKKVPQWEAVSEVALIRAANGDLVAACRTDSPERFRKEIDHYEGLGISISKDDGQTWSAVRKLYDWGRHHPSSIRMPNNDIVMTYVVRKGYVDTKDGLPQFGIEAVISRDNGQTWDLDHRYILHLWPGNRKARERWWPSSQATSSVLLPDGWILTAFGTGYRCQADAKGMPAPRDVGLVQWRLNAAPVNSDRRVSDAPFDSEVRNVFDPTP